jgi:hypothetical protein
LRPPDAGTTRSIDVPGSCRAWTTSACELPLGWGRGAAPISTVSRLTTLAASRDDPSGAARVWPGSTVTGGRPMRVREPTDRRGVPSRETGGAASESGGIVLMLDFTDSI